MKTNLWKRLTIWHAGPSHTELDLAYFKTLDNDAIKSLFYRLLDGEPHGPQFRRLCFYLALRWIEVKDRAAVIREPAHGGALISSRATKSSQAEFKA